VIGGVNNEYKIGKNKYLSLIKNIYTQNETEFMWKINNISDNNIYAITKTKFNNSYSDWLGNHT
jgi:hypothetical protein